jgi:hypothetical protein
MARLVFAALSVAVTVGLISASAQSADQADRQRLRTLTGIAKSVSASSVTLEAAGREVTFTTVSSTRFIGKGRPSSRDLVLRTPKGVTALDAVNVGDRVAVAYRSVGDARIAVEIRVIRKS